MAESRKEASLEQLTQSIGAIANQVRVIDEIIHSAQLIKRRGEGMDVGGAAEGSRVSGRWGGLQDQVKGLRGEAAR